MLTSIARRIYCALVENPEATDATIARGLSMSHCTVAKARERFEGEGLIKTAVVPDLARLGFGMLVFDHARLNLRIGERQRREILDELVRIKPPVFLAVGGEDVAALTAYEDFDTYRRCVNGFSEVYKKDDIFVKEPRRLMFSLAEMKMLKEHEYGPVVRRVLGI